MKLNENQQRYANMVAAEARRQGVNPDLAISVAFAESGLNPSTPPSSKGAVGLMQLLPSTAEELGVDPNDLTQNIRGGVTYLRQLGERFENDPVKTLSAYNAGPNSKFLETNNSKDVPTETLKYVIKISDLHGGNLPPVIAPKKEVAGEKEIDVKAIEKARDEFGPQFERRAGQLVGGGAGLATGIPLQSARLLGNAFRGNIPGAVSEPPPRPGPVRPPAQPSAQPPLGGTGTQNYAKAFGLGDIEAGRALDMTKQPGGVHDLTTQRRTGLQRVNELFPNQFREDPRFGGLMTPTERPGPGPRGPTGQIGGGKPPPLVKPPGPLKQVTDMFQSMASGYPKATRGLATVAQRLPVVSYPLAGASIGGDLASMASDLSQDKPDYYGATLKGLGAFGTGLSMFPATAPFGVPLATIPPLIQYYRENPSTVEPNVVSP